MSNERMPNLQDIGLVFRVVTKEFFAPVTRLFKIFQNSELEKLNSIFVGKKSEVANENPLSTKKNRDVSPEKEEILNEVSAIIETLSTKFEGDIQNINSEIARLKSDLRNISNKRVNASKDIQAAVRRRMALSNLDINQISKSTAASGKSDRSSPKLDYMAKGIVIVDGKDVLVEGEFVDIGLESANLQKVPYYRVKKVTFADDKKLSTDKLKSNFPFSERLTQEKK